MAGITAWPCRVWETREGCRTGNYPVSGFSVYSLSNPIDFMPLNTPSAPNPAPPPATPPPPKKRKWFLYGCGTLLALALVIVATVAITIWWIQRPIEPVVLSPQEKAVVDQKLQHLTAERSSSPVSNPKHPPGAISHPPNASQEPDRPYVPGSKVLKLTEREVNGLLNANTDLGNSVRLEFARDAINAYVAIPIPKDSPIGAGKTFRARGRFALSLTSDGAPYAILEDVTVFGLSLPKAWLGGLKGENLLADAAGRRNGKPILQGIKSLRVEPGALVIEVED